MSYKKVQVIIFRKTSDTVEILLLLRSGDKTWQPVTGGVEEGETFLDAAKRESLEETGLKSPIRIIDNIFSFSFDNPPGHWRAGHVDEQVFAFEVSDDFVPKISEEHLDNKWVEASEALDIIISNNQKIALQNLLSAI